jgi:hypothetical protein
VSCGEPEDCGDGVDNDDDGKTDCYDPDCSGDPACRSAEVACADGLDNDQDSSTDCEDTDCVNDEACLPESNCRDMIDNDQDSYTDCEDDDCANDSWCNAEQICDDQYDNDNDHDTDCWDPDCEEDAYCQAEADCHDDIDNDADYHTDCEDTDCASDPWCLPESVCNDDMDNDHDGLTDCDDEDCTGDPNCVEHCTPDETFTECNQSRNDSTTGQPNNVTFYECYDLEDFEGPEYVYAYTPSRNGRIRFQVTAAGWDSYLFVLEDECTPSLPCYSYYDAPAGATERVDVSDAVAGTTYYAIIDSVSAGESGAFNFLMVCEGPEVCDDGFDNDFDDLPDCVDDDCYLDPACTNTCTADETIGCNSDDLDDTGSTNRITTYNCTSSNFFPGGERIYRFTPSSNVYVTATIQGNIGDFALFALEGACAPDQACVDWDDEDGGIGVDQEVVEFQATAGTDYFIIVDSTDSGFSLGYWLFLDCQ